MVDKSQIKEMMEVKGSDGKHVGTVDHVEGDRVSMAAGGTFHSIDLEIVDSVQDGVVRLGVTAEDTKELWQ